MIQAGKTPSLVVQANIKIMKDTSQTICKELIENKTRTENENGPETQSLFNCKINFGLFDEMTFKIAPD